MTSENPRLNPSIADRVLRSITFLVLSFAVFGSFVLKPTEEPANSLIEKSVRARSDLFFKLVVMQALSMNILDSEKEKATLKDSIIKELQMIDSDPAFRNAEVEVQRRILLEFLGEDISGFDDAALGSYRASFDAMYSNESAPREGDPILALPAARIALLQYSKRNDRALHQTQMEEVRKEASALQLKLALGTAVFLGVVLLGLYGMTRFLFNRPPAYYGRFLESVLVPKQPVFMEAAILFLFLIFPVSMLLSRFIPQSLMFEFHLVYMPIAFLAALFYFRSETGSKLLGWTFWIPVIDQKDQVDPVPRPLLPSFFKEVIIGIAAWAVIFPLGLLVTLLTMALFGDQASGMRFAHPIVYHLEGNFARAFILAVIIVPIIEETIFRNFVYGFFRFRFSMIFAALLSGFFFAVLHPQGAIALPYLTVLGTGLAILREHRPGIIAPVVTHMMVNALALVAMKFFL